MYDALPFGADDLAAAEPVYEELPGWQERTAGIRNFDQLPQAAQNYLKRMEEVCQTPISMISTGPDRTETIVFHHPFG